METVLIINTTDHTKWRDMITNTYNNATQVINELYPLIIITLLLQFRNMIDLYKSGDYITIIVEERNFMIQVRTVPCYGGSVTCICGVVVREHNDVIKYVFLKIICVIKIY